MIYRKGNKNVVVEFTEDVETRDKSYKRKPTQKMCINPSCRNKGKKQPIENFYVIKGNADGHSNFCKKCQNKRCAEFAKKRNRRTIEKEKASGKLMFLRNSVWLYVKCTNRFGVLFCTKTERMAKAGCKLSFFQEKFPDVEFKVSYE